MTTWKHQPEMSKELQHAHPECQLLESCQHHKPWQPKESLELLNLEQSHQQCSFQPKYERWFLFEINILKEIKDQKNLNTIQ